MSLFYREVKDEGKLEGKLESKLEVVPALAARGFLVKEIAQTLGINEDQVKSVQP